MHLRSSSDTHGNSRALTECGPTRRGYFVFMNNSWRKSQQSCLCICNNGMLLLTWPSFSYFQINLDLQYFCEKSSISGPTVNNMLDWSDDNTYATEKKTINY